MICFHKLGLTKIPSKAIIVKALDRYKLIIMKTYIFGDNNSNVLLFLPAKTFEEAMELLVKTVKCPADFKCINA